jgi:hypothetical protein
MPFFGSVAQWVRSHPVWTGMAAVVVLAVPLARWPPVWFRFPHVSTGQVWGAGLGAALISAVIAALVAYGVVQATFRYQRKQSADERAEDFVIGLAQAVAGEADWVDPEFAFGVAALEAIGSPAAPAERDWWVVRRRYWSTLVGAQVAATAALHRIGAHEMAVSVDGSVHVLEHLGYQLNQHASAGHVGDFARAAQEIEIEANEFVLNLAVWLRDRSVRERFRQVHRSSDPRVRPHYERTSPRKLAEPNPLAPPPDEDRAEG